MNIISKDLIVNMNGLVINMDRQQYYLKVAEITGERSTCRIPVGAVAVKDNRVILTAYSGAPSHMQECRTVGCHMVNGHCERTVHAEQNIITYAAKFGTALEGAEIYCTHEPCGRCMKLIISAGIKKVYFINAYQDDRTLSDYYYHLEVYQYNKEDNDFIRIRW